MPTQKPNALSGIPPEAPESPAARERSHDRRKYLASRTAMLVGVGALGTPLAILLRSLGFRRFLLVDPKKHKESGIRTQCQPGDVGVAKVHALSRQLLALGAEAAVPLASAVEDIEPRCGGRVNVRSTLWNASGQRSRPRDAAAVLPTPGRTRLRVRNAELVGLPPVHDVVLCHLRLERRRFPFSRTNPLLRPGNRAPDRKPESSVVLRRELGRADPCPRSGAGSPARLGALASTVELYADVPGGRDQRTAASGVLRMPKATPGSGASDLAADGRELHGPSRAQWLPGEAMLASRLR